MSFYAIREQASEILNIHSNTPGGPLSRIGSLRTRGCLPSGMRACARTSPSRTLLGLICPSPVRIRRFSAPLVIPIGGAQIGPEQPARHRTPSSTSRRGSEPCGSPRPPDARLPTPPTTLLVPTHGEGHRSSKFVLVPDRAFGTPIKNDAKSDHRNKLIATRSFFVRCNF
jgi:hypothetical protein